FGLIKRVIAAADGPFDVAEDDIRPSCAFRLGGGTATTGDEHGVGVTEVGKAAKAGQSVAEGFRVCGQTALPPLQQRPIAEVPHRLDDREGRVFQLVVGTHGDHEGLLVLRTTPPLAAIAFTAEIRIVDLYEAPE